MGVIEKLKCDARNCGREETLLESKPGPGGYSSPIALNHLWTLVLVPNRQAVIFPGLLLEPAPLLADGMVGSGHVRYACGPECVQRLLGEWMGKVLGHEEAQERP